MSTINLDYEKLPVDLIRRFTREVLKDRKTSCWFYMGTKDQNGYGHVSVTGTGNSVYAHRLGYLLRHRLIPAGLFVLHRCDNPSCVNPDHLFVGTQADNMADKVSKGRSALGETNGRAKLTDTQAYEIKHSQARGKDLAKQYGVSPSRISAIRCGHNWSHV